MVVLTGCKWDDSLHKDFVNDDGTVAPKCDGLAYIAAITASSSERCTKDSKSDTCRGFESAFKHERCPKSYLCMTDEDGKTHYCGQPTRCPNLAYIVVSNSETCEAGDDAEACKRFALNFEHSYCPIGYECQEDEDDDESGNKSYCQQVLRCPPGQILCGPREGGNSDDTARCINPISDSNFCGAKEDCRGGNAGEDCTKGEGRRVCQERKCESICPDGSGCFFGDRCYYNNEERCGADCKNCLGTGVSEADCTDDDKCFTTRCAGGYHMKDNGTCHPNDDENCGSTSGGSITNCKALGGICRFDGSCYGACSEDEHLRDDGQCERNSITVCGPARVNCTALAGWESGECDKGKCVAKTCKAEERYCLVDNVDNKTCQLALFGTGPCSGNSCVPCASSEVCYAGECKVDPCPGQIDVCVNGCENTPTGCGVGCANCMVEGNAEAGECQADFTCKITKCRPRFHIEINEGKRVCVANTATSCARQDEETPRSCHDEGTIGTCTDEGVCEIAECRPGFAKRGEVCVKNTEKSCGESDVDCTKAYPNADVACGLDNRCAITKCHDDYNLNTSGQCVLEVGCCGTSCANCNANGRADTCRSNSCVCGSSDSPCEGNGVICKDDECTCPAGRVLCDGNCIDPNNDRFYCGVGADCSSAGGDKCGSNQVCRNGKCEPIVCPADMVACNNECIDPRTSKTHCGARGACSTDTRNHADFKGVNCGAGTCENGLCKCGTALCNNGETCNPAGTQCQCGTTAGACADKKQQNCGDNGQCNDWCNNSDGGKSSFMAVCGDRCINPMTSNTHCGAKGKCDNTGSAGTNYSGMDCSGGRVCVNGTCESCPAGKIFMNGACACPAGMVLCGGNCIDPQTSKTHCGARGTCSVTGRNAPDFRGVNCGTGSCVEGLCQCSGAATSCDLGKTCNGENKCQCDLGRQDMCEGIQSYCNNEGACVHNCSSRNDGYIALCGEPGNKQCINSGSNDKYCGAKGACNSPVAGNNYQGVTCSDGRVCVGGVCVVL